MEKHTTDVPYMQDQVTDKELDVEEVDDQTSKDIFSYTKWKSIPSAEDIVREVELAAPAYKKHIEKIDERKKALSGDIDINIKTGRSKYKSHLIKRQLQWRYASLEHALLSSKDMFDADPRGKNDKADASQVEALLSKQFYYDIDRVNFIGKSVRNITNHAMLVWKVGWNTEEKNIDFIEEEFKNIPKTNDPQEMQQLIAQLEAGSITEDDVYTREKISEKKVTKKEVIFNGPVVDVIEPEDIMISPLDDNTVLHRFKTTKSELYQYDYYFDIDKIPEKKSSKDEDRNPIEMADEEFVKKQKEELSGKETDYINVAKNPLTVIEVWTQWDINNDGKLVPIVISICNGVIIRMEENPFPFKKPPFVFIKYDYAFSDEDDGVYSSSCDIDILHDSQKIEGALMRGIIDLHARSANSQRGMALGALTDTERRKYENGEDYFFNPGIDPTKAFYMHEYPQVPGTVFNLIEQINNTAESQSGVKGFSTGISGDAFGSVATAVRSTVDAVSKRETSVLRRIGKGLEELARMILSMDAVNLSDDEIIKTSDGREVKIDRDVLSANYNIIFSVSTPEKDLEQADNLSFLLQTIGNNIPQEVTYHIMADIAKLKGRPELSSKLENYQPQPDPMEQQKVQLEIMKLRADVAKENAMAAYYNAQAALAGAKGGTEQEKAKVLSRDADKRDLEFVERVKGRDIEKQKELEDHKFHLDLGKQAAGSLLDKETPNAVHSNIGDHLVATPSSNVVTNEEPGMVDAEDQGSEALRR